MNDAAALPQPALSVRQQRFGNCSGCFVRGIFSMFLIIGSIMLYFMAIRPLWGVLVAQDWVETPCTILSSELKRHRGDENDSFTIEITYRYEMGGKAYVGDRYHFGQIKSNTQVEWKREIVTSHPVGHRTMCYVDPHDPNEAVIERGVTIGMLWGLFPLAFVAMGLGGLIFAPRLLQSNQIGDASTAASTGKSTRDSSGLSFPTSSALDGPLTLKPETTPGCLFLVSLGFCLFWNGIVSVFVWQLISEHRAGNPNWFLTIFMIPFVLVGIGLVLYVFYTFLTLFNPRPELTLATGHVPLGSMNSVTWRFRGSVRSLRNLKLALKGEEQATYRRGTDTHTDEEPFFEHVFYEAEHEAHMATGEAEFEVPTDSMHSFESNNNKIVWTLEVTGDIAFWPDVNLSFPIQVLPHD